MHRLHKEDKPMSFLKIISVGRQWLMCSGNEFIISLPLHEFEQILKNIKPPKE